MGWRFRYADDGSAHCTVFASSVSDRTGSHRHYRSIDIDGKPSTTAKWRSSLSAYRGVLKNLLETAKKGNLPAAARVTNEVENYQFIL